MLIKYVTIPLPDSSHNPHHVMTTERANRSANRVRTLTGKEIELDIEMDYKVLPRAH